MEQLTFREYILTKTKICKSPAGGFVRNAKCDKELPATAKCILERAIMNGTWQDADAALLCYRNYCAYCKARNIKPEGR